MTMPSNKWEEALGEVLAVLYKEASLFTKRPEKNNVYISDAKLALTNAVKEIVETAKPDDRPELEFYGDGIDDFEANLLKAIGDTDG